MASKSYAAALLVAGAVLARPQPLIAQVSLPAGVKVSAEFGGRTFTQDVNERQLGKFTEYRDLPSGALLSAFALQFTPADSGRQFMLTARNVGRLDQSLGVTAREPGLFNLQFQWDRIPHTFSTTARSLGTRPTPDFFSLAGAPRGDTGSVNTALNALTSYMPTVRSMWDPMKLSFGYTPNEALDSRVEYTRISKQGDRPLGMAFGSPGGNAREILEPLDQTMHDLKVSQGFAKSHFQIMASYDLSLFRNGFSSVTADNPLIGTDRPNGPSHGRTALAPDNVAHTVVGSVGGSLPLHTRVTGSLSYAWWRQDQAFIAPTINSAITDPRTMTIPKSLNGQAGTSVVSLTADSRPVQGLALSARYRSFEFRDAADVASMPVEIINDQSVSGPVDVQRDPFSRRTADASATYALLQPLSVFAGYNWERTGLSNRERNTSAYVERTPRVGLVISGTDWLSFRTTYSRSTRRNEGYENNPGYIDGWQRFDLADRDRERFTVVTTVTPLDEVSLSTTWNVGHDNYPDVLYGVQNDRNGAIGGDIDWSPNPRFSAGFGYSREEDKNRMTAKYRTPSQLNNSTFDWVANNIDHSTVTSANMSAVLVPGKLDVGATFQMSHSRFRLATANPQTPAGGTESDRLNATATDLPEITQNLQPLNLFARYTLTQDWAATLRFQSEMFDQNDFRLVGSKPGWWNMVFLGNQFQNYNAQFVTVTLTYRPGSVKGKRSAL